MTRIQAQLFKDFSGEDYEFDIGEPDTSDTGKPTRGFSCKYPYNDRDWKMSPWWFSYAIDEAGNLIMELDHRMTNNRIRAYDENGKQLGSDVSGVYFTPHM